MLIPGLQKLQYIRRSVVLGGLFLSSASVILTGCSGNFGSFPETNMGDVHVTVVGSLQGSTYGGQQPIWQSHVYLMKASTGGYGTPATSMLKAAANTTVDSNGNYYVTTNGYGNFDITGDYTCNYNATTPSQSDQLYIVSLGGNATYTPPYSAPTGGATNAYIGLMSVLGQCPSNGTFAGHVSFIYVNEVSTVAAAYALAGFATNSSRVGSASTALSQVGLANAFANAGQLYDITGSSVGHEARTVTPNGLGAVPYRMVNTLGNILAACINQGLTAAVPASGACQTLYSNTGNAPDAASAMIYVAQHPASNVSTLYALAGSSVQFIDALTNKPNDFTVGINYSGTGLTNPVDVAIDGAGNAWVTSSSGYLSKLSPLGVHATGSPFTVSGANYVALDSGATPVAWVSTTTTNGVAQLTYQVNNTVNGLVGSLVGPLTSTTDFSYPAAVAVYGTNYSYVANPGGGGVLFGLLGSTGDVGLIAGSGANAPVSYYASFLNTTFYNQIPTVSQAAVDSTGAVWVSGDGVSCTLLLICYGTNVQRIAPSAFSQAGTPGAPSFSVQAGSFFCFIFCSVSETPTGIAIDAGNNGWVALAGNSNALDKITSAGAVSATYTGGGLSNPQGVAIDGAGNVFVGNAGNSTLSEYSSAGATPGFVTGSTGYMGANNATNPASVLSTPTNLDVDESGNVWVVNAAGGSGYITEFIGMAKPAVRPLSAAAASNKLAALP